MYEPCPIPSRERGHKAEHKEEQADSQADKAEDIQEDAEPSNNLRTMGCHELQLDQPE